MKLISRQSNRYIECRDKHEVEYMVIHTKRCTVRPFEEADIDDFMLYRNNMDWMKYQGFKGLERRDYLAALIGESSLKRGIQLAVILNETNVLIGDIYIKEESSDYWIGYTISPFKARQGFAYEVVSAVMNVLWTDGAMCIKAAVESENIASLSMLKKLGFDYAETIDGEQIFIVRKHIEGW